MSKIMYNYVMSKGTQYQTLERDKQIMEILLKKKNTTRPQIRDYLKNSDISFSDGLINQLSVILKRANEKQKRSITNKKKTISEVYSSLKEKKSNTIPFTVLFKNYQSEINNSLDLLIECFHSINSNELTFGDSYQSKETNISAIICCLKGYLLLFKALFDNSYIGKKDLIKIIDELNHLINHDYICKDGKSANKEMFTSYTLNLLFGLEDFIFYLETDNEIYLKRGYN